MTEDLSDFTQSDFYNLLTSEKLEAANDLNQKADEAITGRNFELAQKLTVEAIQKLNYTFPETEEEKSEFNFAMVTAQNRMSSINIRHDQLSAAQEHVETALKLDPINIKSMLLKAKILYKTELFADVAEVLDEVLALDPGNE
jgi:hypothetical protein